MKRTLSFKDPGPLVRIHGIIDFEIPGHFKWTFKEYI